MTSAVVRAVYSPDVEEVWTARPLIDVPDPFLLELEIGPAGEAGRDLFAVLVGTRHALGLRGRSRCLAIEDIPSPVDHTADIVAFLEHRIGLCEGPDWEALCRCLRSFLDWEYDDYTGGL